MPTAKNTDASASSSCRVFACDDLEASRAASGQAPTLQKAGGSAWTLWLWVGGAFLLLVLAWGVLFTLASSAKVESVPLATKGVKS